MNCHDFHELAQALARDERLEPAILDNALSHADSCASCDSLLEESEALTASLRTLGAHCAAENAPVALGENLLLAFRKQHEPAVHGLPNLRWRPMALVSIAASIVLVLAVTGRPKALWNASWLTHSDRAASSRNPSESAGPAPSVRQASTSTEEGEAGSFVPLSGTFDLASLNEEPIVRVVLSGDDLEGLGLPVSDAGDEQVVADLIIANDGTPQAIRVVSW